MTSFGAKAEPGGLGKKLRDEIDRALEAIRPSQTAEEVMVDCCTLPAGVGHVFSWAAGSRRSCAPIESTIFQDHDGRSITFKEFFSQALSIVVFFYTRCDNPLKCSLTITKLARIQKLLAERCLGDQIQTAAITYDPAFDLPARIHIYGDKRGLNFGERHRMLRAVDGIEAIRKHFKLGVNFIESLVNRHRIEVYILDDCGRVAASFEWLQPLLAVVIAINLGSVWLRARNAGRMLSFYLVSAGALMIVLSRTSGLQQAAMWGVVFTMAGSFFSTFTTRNRNREAPPSVSKV